MKSELEVTFCAAIVVAVLDYQILQIISDINPLNPELTLSLPN
jgi:hypothetical protein